jgi:hypothetical protein
MILVMILLGVGFGAAHPPYATINAYKYDTFYSPEKKFSIDYAPTDTFPLNITEKSDEVKIQTGPIDITVLIIENPLYKDISQLAVHTQKQMQGRGDTIEETTHPVIIDGKTGYSFTTTYHIKALNGPIFHDYIFVENDGKTLQFNFQYHVSHYLLGYDEILHSMESIKLFS